MLMKIKQWFSIENNFNLVRDILFIGSLLLALLFGLSFSSCAPVAHAAEVEATVEYVPTNIINRFKMAPYIDIDENTGLSKYDGKYFTGELLDYWVLFKQNNAYYLYTYIQHGDDYTTDGPGTESYTYGIGLYYDEVKGGYCRHYVSQEVLYYWSPLDSVWVVTNPITPFGTGDGLIVTDFCEVIGANFNIMNTQNPNGLRPHYMSPKQEGHFGVADYTLNMSEALFAVAKQAIDFIVSNPVILVSTLLFIFVAGAGIVKTFVTGA